MIALFVSRVLSYLSICKNFVILIFLNGLETFVWLILLSKYEYIISGVGYFN